MARENELYRDKIEVSLDGRQIFSLFFAGAVIVCTVFVIGVIVGKRVEARAHVDRGAAASGDPLAALDRLEADAPLSFRHTLRGGQAASGSVDAEIAAMASAQKAAGGDPAKGAKPGTEEPAEEPAEGEDAVSAEQAAKKADKQAAKEAAKDADRGAKSEQAAKPHDDERAEAKPDKSEKSDKSDKAERSDKSDKSDKPAKADKLAKADDKSDKPDEKKKAKYTLQLSSFQERGEAETFLSELRAAGYTASVVPAEIEGKGTFYRVRLGTYPSFDDAVKAKAEFERKVNRIAYVTKL